MTYADVLAKAFEEATGLDRRQFEDAVRKTRERFADRQLDWDKELPRHEARQLLRKLRKEKSGIRAWFLRVAARGLAEEPPEILQ